ncbi:guanine deaminase [Martensiomyces pterosporus]|nr:guanine deaminase [Martensiomyces pterosporus]
MAPANSAQTADPLVTYTVFYGCIIDTPAIDSLRIRARGALGVDSTTGRIIGVAENTALSPADLVRSWTGRAVHDNAVEVVRLSADQFLMPGFIDTHTHAPQFTFLGIGHDLPLMDWLNKYTFRHESEFRDPVKAREFYKDVVSRVVRNGVTFAAYYGTIHVEANKILAETIRNIGQRAYVGKVCMDANSPDYYSESTEESLQATEQFVKHVLGGQEADQSSRLVTPIITPRFAPSCSRECLQGLGDLARQYSLPIQSHLCENPAEIEFAKSCFPECSSYAEIYNKFGLFGDRTIMAHCVHMTDGEIALMRQTGVGVSHCPNSNFTLGSGVADVRRFVAEGIPVGLGTDVSGGYTPSMLDAMRMAAAANRALISFKRDRGDKMEGRDGVPLEAAEAVFLATQGGARVMGMEEHVGSLDSKKLFDALVVDLSAANSPVPSVQSTPAVESADDPAEAWKLRLEQFVFLADDRNIARVYVGGRLIHTSSAQ